MAITYNAASSGTVSSSTTMTIAHTITGPNPILWVGVLDDGGINNVTGITYAGFSLTRLNQVQQAGSGYISLWYILSPTSGTNNIVYTMSAASNPVSVNASYQNVLQSGVPDAQTSQSGTTSTSTTGTLTTIADNCWTIMFARAGVAMTPGGGTTSRVNPFTSTLEIFDSNGAITPPASTSLSFTNASTTTSFIMASFAPATSSGNSGFFNFM